MLGLVGDTVKLTWDALTGKDKETAQQAWSAAKEGMKVSTVLNGAANLASLPIMSKVNSYSAFSNTPTLSDSEITALQQEYAAIQEQRKMQELEAAYEKYVGPIEVGTSSEATQSTIAFDSPILHGVVPKGASLTNVRNIAGAEINVAIRDVDRLVKMYGGEPLQWMKKGGIIKIDNFKYDVHWYEIGNNHHEEKVKEVRPNA